MARSSSALEAGIPSIYMLAGAAGVDGGVAFISIVDENGTYDLGSQQWRKLPDPGVDAYVQTIAGAGAALAISYDEAVFPSPDGDYAARLATYSPGQATWRVTSEPPFSGWHGPSLAWTGHELLAWGGVGRDRKPMSAGASYDPVLDSWREASSPPTGAGFATPAVAAEGRVVSWTGSTEGSTPRVATYDPRSDSWVDAPTHCGPRPRRNPVFAWVGDGVVVWGGIVPDCDGTSHPVDCQNSELQRAFHLPAAALFGEVHDARDCACPELR